MMYRTIRRDYSTVTNWQISVWILLIVAFAFVSMRVYARVGRVREKLQWSEILLIVAALDALGLAICDTLAFDMGAMDSYKSTKRISKVWLSSAGWFIPRIEVYVLISQQILFASNYFYDFGLSIAKLSMLAFYSSCLDPSSHSWMRRVLRDATVFVIACYLTSLLNDTFFCGKDVSV